MGIILGFSLFIGVFVGALISIPLVIATVIAAVKGAGRRMHVWRMFVPVALISLSVLIFGVYHYPFDTGTPGSNYTSLFGHFFFVGLAYAVIPGAATVMALLSTFFCLRADSGLKGGP